ncbi:MAG: YrhK family protein [Nitrococcus sp.]|nr:YrhK family protein [Nitrococcus sp.]
MSTERFRRLVNDFGWFHQGIGVLGGLLFFIGSILFLWKDPLQLIGIYLFSAWPKNTNPLKQHHK